VEDRRLKSAGMKGDGRRSEGRRSEGRVKGRSERRWSDGSKDVGVNGEERRNEG
jgi:hypothetical protein